MTSQHAVYVSGLNDSVDSHALWHFALQFGAVSTINIGSHPTSGEMEAVIYFEGQDGLQGCLENHQSNQIYGQFVAVKIATPTECYRLSSQPEGEQGEEVERQPRASNLNLFQPKQPPGHPGTQNWPNRSNAPPPNPNTVFCGGLGQTITQDNLFEFLSTFGEIVNCEIKMDAQTNKSRGFGFCTFVDKQSVDMLVDNYHRNAINGKWFDVKRVGESVINVNKVEPDDILQRKVFVGGLAQHITEDEFHDHFAQFGPIVVSYIRKGFGFVQFENFETAQEVLAIEGHEIGGRPVDIKNCLRKEDVKQVHSHKHIRLAKKLKKQQEEEERIANGGPPLTADEHSVELQDEFCDDSTSNGAKGGAGNATGSRQGKRRNEGYRDMDKSQKSRKGGDWDDEDWDPWWWGPWFMDAMAYMFQKGKGKGKGWGAEWDDGKGYKGWKGKGKGRSGPYY